MACEDEECISVLVPVEFVAPCCQADDDGDTLGGDDALKRTPPEYRCMFG